VISAREILHKLHTLGARVERNGDRLILRAGTKPVPGQLIREARAVKTELLATLASASLRQPRAVLTPARGVPHADEHLRKKAEPNPAENLACAYPAQMSTLDER
jgi:hypothetical protein